MNMKFKTAMALALSAGLVLQAPVVAFATEAPGLSISIDENGGENINKPTTVDKESGTYNYEIISSINIDPTDTSAEYPITSSATAVTVSNESSFSVNVDINNKTIDADRYATGETNSLEVQGVAIKTNQISGDGTVTVNATGSIYTVILIA